MTCSNGLLQECYKEYQLMDMLLNSQVGDSEFEIQITIANDVKSEWQGNRK